MKIWTALVAWTLVWSMGLAGAQTTGPASQPARRELVVPPGLKVIEVAGRHVVATDADESWVRRALASVTPATRPTSGRRACAAGAIVATRAGAMTRMPRPEEIDRLISEQDGDGT